MPEGGYIEFQYTRPPRVDCVPCCSDFHLLDFVNLFVHAPLIVIESCQILRPFLSGVLFFYTPRRLRFVWQVI